MTTRSRIAFGLSFLFLVQAVDLYPQDSTPSRINEIQAQRLAKKSQLKPAEPEKLEQTFIKVQDAAETITASPSGLRLKLSSTAPGWDGLIPGSGFTVGGEYYQPDLLDGEMAFRMAAVGTTKQNYLFDTQFTLPRLMNARLAVDLLGRYKAERSINYYGSGPETRKGDRTNYTRETTEADAAIRWRPFRRLGVGATAGLLWFNVGPGIANRISSTEQIFTPIEAPGLDQQTDFVRGGPYVLFDSRISPVLSPRGTQIRVGFDQYHDLNDDGFSFGVIEALVQHTFAFFNEKRLLILRAASTTSHTRNGNVVPFYLQQSLGGPDDLRGFRVYRFSDDNKLALNAEYRWEVAPPLDMALFADAGKVFPDPGQLNFSNIEGSGGFGLRFKTRSAVPLRIDVAFSREGMNLWFRFSDLF